MLGLWLCRHVDEPHLLLLGLHFGRQDSCVASLQQVDSVLLHVHCDVLRIDLVLNLLLSAELGLTLQEQSSLQSPVLQISLLFDLG